MKKMDKIETLNKSIENDQQKILKLQGYILNVTNNKLLFFIESIILKLEIAISTKQDLIAYEENRLAALES
jgi:hypothetical protein